MGTTEYNIEDSSGGVGTNECNVIYKYLTRHMTPRPMPSHELYFKTKDFLLLVFFLNIYISLRSKVTDIYHPLAEIRSQIYTTP